MIKEFIDKTIREYVDNDSQRFDELWEVLPNFADEIKKVINAQNSWIYLTPQTFDGWYLIQNKQGYDLFYQERVGNVWGTKHYENEQEAITMLLLSSGCLKF